MKQMLRLGMLLVVLTTCAFAQKRFEYYNIESQYFLLNLPVNSIMLTRYDSPTPIHINEISAWFVTQPTQGGSVDLVIFGKEGGSAYPYQLQQLLQPIRVDIPAGKDSLYRFLLQTPVTFDKPTQFFVGIIKRDDNVNVRMDRYQQMIPCANAQEDSMYTNLFAIYNAPTTSYAFGAHFVNGMAVNNWYMGCAGQPFNEQPMTFFTDVTDQAGLNLMPNLNKRIAWGDYNGDGYQDILWGNYLFKNNGNGTFAEVAKSSGYTAGSEVQMFVDVDNDGDLDIVCQPANLLYLNDSGNFSLQSNPGFVQSVNTQAMCFADYNKDLYPDMFVANGEYIYVKNPNNQKDSALAEGAAFQARLYVNNKNGTFTEATSNLGAYTKGMYGLNPYTGQYSVEGYRPATCAQWIDFDNDGDMDLYIGVDRLQPNYLYENQGTPLLRSIAQAYSAQGGIKPGYPGLFGNTKGCDFGDYNNDGTLDLVAGEVALPYRLAYSDRTSVWKVDPALSNNFINTQPTSKLEYQVRQADVAWGDFNNDGMLDFCVTSGEGCYSSMLYMQNQDGSFTDVTYSSGTAVENGFGVAWADFDNDGDLDLAIISETGMHLYRNDMPNMQNWTEVNLRSSSGNKFAIGARVKVYAGNSVFTRLVMAGKGAGSQHPYVQHIGIGSAAKIDSILIRWPGAKSFVTIKDPMINKLLNINETPPVSVETIAEVKTINLQQNYPNPFSKSKSSHTSIAYNLPSTSDVRIEIFDVTGALIKVLVDKTQQAGMYFVQWDGKNDRGEQVASGSYQYILRSDNVILTKRMIMVR